MTSARKKARILTAASAICDLPVVITAISRREWEIDGGMVASPKLLFPQLQELRRYTGLESSPTIVELRILPSASRQSFSGSSFLALERTSGSSVPAQEWFSGSRKVTLLKKGYPAHERLPCAREVTLPRKRWLAAMQNAFFFFFFFFFKESKNRGNSNLRAPNIFRLGILMWRAEDNRKKKIICRHYLHPWVPRIRVSSQRVLKTGSVP